MVRRHATRWLVISILIVGALLPWFSMWDHALTGRSEGRYAWTSVVMARTGEWLVPTYLGHPHLTKPPMIYWMQAACVRLFGANEFAVRFPSALAGSLSVVLAFLIGRRLVGARRGAIGAALYAVMPIHIVIAQMAVTDASLNVCWNGALIAGYLAVERRSRRWSLAMWGCVALGLMIKGPVALVPVGVLLVWLALGGRWREAGRLGFLSGLPIAVAPILAWVVAVIVRHPEALSIWKHEMLDRATGAGDHTRPFWYFVPVVLIGMFPATAMLTLPWFNIGWRESARCFRAGDARALLLLAVVLPVVMFSLIAGKLASYVLPCAIPLALLVSRAVEVWVTREHIDEPRRVPEVRITLLVASVLLFATAAVLLPYRFGASWLWAAAPIGAAALALLWVALHWRAGTDARLMGLYTAWGLMVFSIAAAMEIEDEGLARAGRFTMVRAAMNRMDDHAPPAAMTYGIEDGTLSFYLDQDVPEVGSKDLAARIDEGGALIVLTTPQAWAKFGQRWPDQSRQLEKRGGEVEWASDRELLVMGRGNPD